MRRSFSIRPRDAAGWGAGGAFSRLPPRRPVVLPSSRGALVRPRHLVDPVLGARRVRGRRRARDAVFPGVPRRRGDGTSGARRPALNPGLRPGRLGSRSPAGRVERRGSTSEPGSLDELADVSLRSGAAGAGIRVRATSDRVRTFNRGPRRVREGRASRSAGRASPSRSRRGSVPSSSSPSARDRGCPRPSPSRRGFVQKATSGPSSPRGRAVSVSAWPLVRVVTASTRSSATRRRSSGSSRRRTLCRRARESRTGRPRPPRSARVEGPSPRPTEGSRSPSRPARSPGPSRSRCSRSRTSPGAGGRPAPREAVFAARDAPFACRGALRRRPGAGSASGADGSGTGSRGRPATSRQRGSASRCRASRPSRRRRDGRRHPWRASGRRSYSAETSRSSRGSSSGPKVPRSRRTGSSRSPSPGAHVEREDVSAGAARPALPARRRAVLSQGRILPLWSSTRSSGRRARRPVVMEDDSRGRRAARPTSSPSPQRSATGTTSGR